MEYLLLVIIVGLLFSRNLARVLLILPVAIIVLAALAEK